MKINAIKHLSLITSTIPMIRQGKFNSTDYIVQVAKDWMADLEISFSEAIQLLEDLLINLIKITLPEIKLEPGSYPKHEIQLEDGTIIVADIEVWWDDRYEEYGSMVQNVWSYDYEEFPLDIEQLIDDKITIK